MLAVMKFLMGLDEYSGSSRKVGTEISAGHVLISVEATSGSSHGVALLTPAQARAIAQELEHCAAVVEAQTYLMDSETGQPA